MKLKEKDNFRLWANRKFKRYLVLDRCSNPPNEFLSRGRRTLHGSKVEFIKAKLTTLA